MARRTMIAVMIAVFWVLCFSIADASVTVSGYAFLADREDHRDIKVLFEAASPSARTDSTGYFHSKSRLSHEVQPEKSFDFCGMCGYNGRVVIV